MPAISGPIFPETYLSHDHPITHFLSVRDLSGALWEPRHLLAGAGLQTQDGQARSGRQTLGAVPYRIRAAPNQSTGTYRVGRVCGAEAKGSGHT